MAAMAVAVAAAVAVAMAADQQGSNWLVDDLFDPEQQF